MLLDVAVGAPAQQPSRGGALDEVGPPARERVDGAGVAEPDLAGGPHGRVVAHADRAAGGLGRQDLDATVAAVQREQPALGVGHHEAVLVEELQAQRPPTRAAHLGEGAVARDPHDGTVLGAGQRVPGGLDDDVLGAVAGHLEAGGGGAHRAAPPTSSR